MSKKLSATKHYAHYPNDPVHAPWAAYGFRPFFLILPWYVLGMMLIWAGVFAGVLPWYLSADPYSWHAYELMYGVGMAGTAAFVLTGLPELFPGVVPIVGRKLLYWVGLWLAGRVAFLFAFGFGLWIKFALDLAFSLLIIIWVFKPVVLDKLQRHSSVAYTVVGLTALQVWFYLSIAGFSSTSTMDILKVTLGWFMILIVVALKRINMEAVNEVLEASDNYDSDDLFMAKSYRYNLSVFTILLYTTAEFFYPTNSTLAWLAFAAGAAVFGIISDFKLEYGSVIFKPIPIFLALVPIFIGIGYFSLGVNILLKLEYSVYFRHFLTSGAFGLAFIVALLVITMIHTGRALLYEKWMGVAILFIIIATFLRVSIFALSQYYTLFNTLATLFWAGAFIVYYLGAKSYLKSPRADGILG